MLAVFINRLRMLTNLNKDLKCKRSSAKEVAQIDVGAVEQRFLLKN